MDESKVNIRLPEMLPVEGERRDKFGLTERDCREMLDKMKGFPEPDPATNLDMKSFGLSGDCMTSGRSL